MLAHGILLGSQVTCFYSQLERAGLKQSYNRIGFLNVEEREHVYCSLRKGLWTALGSVFHHGDKISEIISLREEGFTAHFNSVNLYLAGSITVGCVGMETSHRKGLAGKSCLLVAAKKQREQRRENEGVSSFSF